MRVFLSNAFESYVSSKSQQILVSEFKWWKADESREFGSYFFGKDCGLVEPKIDGKKYILRHCHLVPLNDKDKLTFWNRNHKWRSRKTSDRILIYVEHNGDYYLIDIIDDPGGHHLIKMVTKDGKTFMGKCAQEASSFLNGSVEMHPV
ncbi:type II toxin-antitoxin system YafO family toxin [Delftia tsuruhatensis]|uniref:type II toxin-antitoxin system YafO family toxin n=1 Tax=Delftia tsuruhatensis TaxID=180282 RepID=UPI002029265D|nr:type II toxin-antitoxin system YafO family toxin [Delftia tsuruhatensis]